MHEKIRIHSQDAGAQVKQNGKANDLIERILKDEFLGVHLTKELIESKLMNANQYIGMAPLQTKQYCEEIAPLIDSYKSSDKVSLTI